VGQRVIQLFRRLLSVNVELDIVVFLGNEELGIIVFLCSGAEDSGFLVQRDVSDGMDRGLMNGVSYSCSERNGAQVRQPRRRDRFTDNDINTASPI
jgi:hypothetical protein